MKSLSRLQLANTYHWKDNEGVERGQSVKWLPFKQQDLNSNPRSCLKSKPKKNQAWWPMLCDFSAGEAGTGRVLRLSQRERGRERLCLKTIKCMAFLGDFFHCWDQISDQNKLGRDGCVSQSLGPVHHGGEGMASGAWSKEWWILVFAPSLLFIWSTVKMGWSTSISRLWMILHRHAQKLMGRGLAPKWSRAGQLDYQY